VYGFASGVAQSQKEDATASSDNERKFENTVPERAPIKVKLKNEQSFKRKENKNWAREMEIEVKNTGTRPIYYVYVVIYMPEITVAGHVLSMRTKYGRKELGLPETSVEPEDVPILPGETVTLRFPENQLRGYEKWRDEDRIYDDPKKIEFNVLIIKFGDGSYLLGPDVKPMPSELKKRSSNDSRSKGNSESCKPNPEVIKTSLPRSFLKEFYSFQPASLLRANFSPLVETAISVPTPVRDDCGCQSVSGCKWGKFDFASCPCDNDFPTVAFAGGCGNSGQCLRYTTVTDPCDTQFNGQQSCTHDDPLPGTCRIGDPTPTPTPTPQPTPTPSPSPPQCAGNAPNPTNCYCNDVVSPPQWTCLCLDLSQPANYQSNGPTGCPAGKFNDGDDCSPSMPETSH
jgi:hypothetical protein